MSFWLVVLGLVNLKPCGDYWRQQDRPGYGTEHAAAHPSFITIQYLISLQSIYAMFRIFDNFFGGCAQLEAINRLLDNLLTLISLAYSLLFYRICKLHLSTPVHIRLSQRNWEFISFADSFISKFSQLP